MIFFIQTMISKFIQNKELESVMFTNFYKIKGNMLTSFYILKIEILSHDNPKLLSQDLIKK